MYTANSLLETNPPQIALDHLLLGVPELNEGIRYVEKLTGVRAAYGGQHPGKGTHNALLSLGKQQYLEIIAPDPAQSGPTWLYDFRQLTEPKLVAWAAQTSAINALHQYLMTNDMVAELPVAGSRARQTGPVLGWQTMRLQENADNLLPFFIEWDAATVHPAVEAPAGCELLDFRIYPTEPTSVANTLANLGLSSAITVLPALGQTVALQADLYCPTGKITLT